MKKTKLFIILYYLKNRGDIGSYLMSKITCVIYRARDERFIELVEKFGIPNKYMS